MGDGPTMHKQQSCVASEKAVAEAINLLNVQSVNTVLLQGKNETLLQPEENTDESAGNSIDHEQLIVLPCEVSCTTTETRLHENMVTLHILGHELQTLVDSGDRKSVV